MGESQQQQLSLEFDARVRLEFVGSKITSDAGLLAYRESDGRLGLAKMADQFLTEQRSERNVQHHLRHPESLEPRAPVAITDTQARSRLL